MRIDVKIEQPLIFFDGFFTPAKSSPVPDKLVHQARYVTAVLQVMLTPLSFALNASRSARSASFPRWGRA